MLKKAIANGTNKLIGVSDVSADECGSIEFTSRFTSIEAPYLLYDVAKDSFKETIGEMDPESNSEILFTSVDHLPAEMPKEASNHFGSKLIPFVSKVVKSDFSKPFEQMDDIPEEIKGAIICAHGKLTPGYTYIQNLREANELVAKQSDKASSAGMQGYTLCLIGHLFDTNGFNKVLNACEEMDVQFRIIEWEIGMNVN